MSEIRQCKQKNERGASVEDVVNSFVGNTEHMESIAVVVLYDDGEIDTAFSSDSTLELAGMLEVAKKEVLDMVIENE